MRELKGRKLSSEILRCLMLIGLTVMTAHLLAAFYPISYGAVGTRDGYQYWAAVELLLRGRNAYDPLELKILGASFGYTAGEISRNPPWTASFMLPWMWGGFSDAIWSWRLVQLLSLLFIWRILVPSTANLRERLVGAIILATFYPVADSFHSGQLGILLALAVGLFLRENKWNYRPAEVIPLCIFLTKPHLFLPVFAYLWCKGRWSSLMVSGLVCIASCVVLFGAHSIVDWINSMINPLHPELRTSLAAFKSNSFSAWLRGILLDNGVGRCDFLIGVFSAFSLGSGWLIAKSSRGFDFDGPLLFLVGLFLAPYGWMSDYAILAPLLLSKQISLSETRHRLFIVAGALIISVCIVCIPSIQTTLTWVILPLAYLFIYGSPKHFIAMK